MRDFLRTVIIRQHAKHMRSLRKQSALINKSLRDLPEGELLISIKMHPDMQTQEAKDQRWLKFELTVDKE